MQVKLISLRRAGGERRASGCRSRSIQRELGAWRASNGLIRRPTPPEHDHTLAMPHRAVGMLGVKVRNGRPLFSIAPTVAADRPGVTIEQRAARVQAVRQTDAAD